MAQQDDKTENLNLGKIKNGGDESGESNSSDSKNANDKKQEESLGKIEKEDSKEKKKSSALFSKDALKDPAKRKKILIVIIIIIGLWVALEEMEMSVIKKKVSQDDKPKAQTEKIEEVSKEEIVEKDIPKEEIIVEKDIPKEEIIVEKDIPKEEIVEKDIPKEEVHKADALVETKTEERADAKVEDKFIEKTVVPEQSPTVSVIEKEESKLKEDVIEADVGEEVEKVADKVEGQESVEKVDKKSDRKEKGVGVANIIEKMDKEIVAKVVEDEAKKQVKKELEYVTPPDYNGLGKGLVYNCKDQHWACVNKKGYNSCKGNAEWSKQNSKIPECSVVSIYRSESDCRIVQIHKINTFAPTPFCIK